MFNAERQQTFVTKLAVAFRNFSRAPNMETSLESLYEAYSESKYRLRIFPPQRWGRDFEQARCLPSFTGKPQTPLRDKQIVFTYCFVRLKCLRWSSAPPTVKYGLLSVFWMQEMWNRLIFIVRYVKYTVKMPWVMEWWNGSERSTKVVITCMTSRGAAGRVVTGGHVPRGVDRETGDPL
jgi:hypothetical protein